MPGLNSRTRRCFAVCGLLGMVALLSGSVSAAEPASGDHWAFQPIPTVTVPAVEPAGAALARSAVDAFVLARLNSQGMTLSGPAGKQVLLRRVMLDLIGLPPTPDELDEFLQDDRPDAFERLVDRLLASPHYGVAWGRQWLDLVRFAETAGFNADPARPLAYKYRDYVIESCNRNVPFDRFVQEQIAGDELFPEDVSALVATGYCRMWADESNASNIHLARQLALNDLTSNVGAAILGLSIGCAQCHDHKFDPLLQTDFYQLQAYFAGIVLEDELPVGSSDQLREYQDQRQLWLKQTADLRHELHTIEREARLKMAGDKRMKFPADVLAAIDCLPEERSPLQRQLAFWSERQMEYKTDDLPRHLSDAQKSRREELLSQLTEARKTQPKPPRKASVMAVAELTAQPPATHLLESGSYDRPQQELGPDVPVVLRRGAPAQAIQAPHARTSGRRSELARWLTARENPLTYRVWINRVWQGHFGRGLVENANDFGVLSAPPKVPGLLDWLTRHYLDSGADTKALHRMIVQSAVYRQSGSRSETPDASETLAAFPRQRLSAERIRDSWLAASGVLNDTLGGPGVRPELPPNFGGAAAWKVSEPADRHRRSAYIYAKRNLPYPLLAAFDFPDMHEACGCRSTTTIAPQALIMLNSQLVLDAARQLAARARSRSDTADPVGAIQEAWKIALARPVHADELEQAQRFLSEQQALIESGGNTATATDEAFVDLCHALLNANEFLFVD